MSPETAAKLYHHSISENSFVTQDYPEWFSFLTEKEIELLKLLKHGDSSKEIADHILRDEFILNQIKI